MKLLIVTSLKEFKKDVSDMLEKAQIPVFSFSEIIGVKTSYTPELSDDWFTSDKDREFRSVFFFSFTDDAKADDVLGQIAVFNTLDRVEYPVRGFILPVEKAI